MLDERKRRILTAIVGDYISSAEPVGSRTLARKYDLGVSPATIRNEMADLESLGFLSRFHTSSGRIPSSKGYRFYVDSLMPRKVSAKDKRVIDEWYRRRTQGAFEVFRETARIISQVTHNLSLVLKEGDTSGAGLYYSGQARLLEQPEFCDIGRVREILLFLEEESRLKAVLRSSPEGLSVKIGREIRCRNICDCSIVTLRLSLGEASPTIAVLGPTRMEYGRAISLLRYMNDYLSNTIGGNPNPKK